MASILEGAQEFLTPSFLSRVSSQTGESEAAVSRGFTAVIPTLLASIASRSGDTGFMSQLVNLATNTSSDPDAVMRAPKAVVADGTLDTSTPTGGWLSALTGGGVSAVTNAIARYAGVRATSASSLLSLGAPLVLGYLGRLMRSDHLDGTRLAQRFQAERGSIAAALPAGFDALLPGGLSSAGASRVAAADTYRAADIPGAMRREKKRAGWLWPVLLVALALLALLWWGSRGSVRAPSVSGAIGSVGSAARMLTRSLPGGVQINVPAGGLEDSLLAYLASPTRTSGSFDFDRIAFETGSTALTASSRAQIANVASILKAYPRARVVVAGYTDNTGDESSNVALSRGRAESVMEALRDNGVPAAAMQAQGYGSASPIADNSTESGRARNRRVTLNVTT